MKRIFVLSALLSLSISASASDLPRELAPYVPRELFEEAQRGGDLAARGFDVLLDSLRGGVGDALAQTLRPIAMLMLLVLLCAMLEGVRSAFGRAARPYVPYFSVLCAAALCAGDLTMFIGLGRETAEELAALSKALLPTVAMAMAAGGCVCSASVWQAGTLMACDLLLSLIQETLLPLLYCYIGAAAAGAILPQSGLERLALGIRKLIGWALCGVSIVFTAYLTLSNVLSGATDRMTVKAGRLAISHAVPVVGGILSEAAETVLSGAGALRGTVGALGIFAVLSVCLLPLLRLGIEYLLYQLSALFSAMLGVSALEKFLEQLSDAFSLLLAMTGCAALFLLVALLVALTMVTMV